MIVLKCDVNGVGLSNDRLAEEAFQAKDDAAHLREQLEDIERQQKQASDKDSTGVPAADKSSSSSSSSIGDAVTTTNGNQLSKTSISDGTRTGDADVPQRDAEGVDATMGRVIDLEVEKWQMELGKQEAERKARDTHLALLEAQAKVW